MNIVTWLFGSKKQQEEKLSPLAAALVLLLRKDGWQCTWNSGDTAEYRLSGCEIKYWNYSGLRCVEIRVPAPIKFSYFENKILLSEFEGMVARILEKAAATA